MAGDHPDSVRSAIEAERRRLAELERQRVESAERLILLEAQLAQQPGATQAQALPFSAPDTPAGKVALFKSLFRGARRRVPEAVDQHAHQAERLRSGVRERMGARSLREAPRAVR